MFFTKPKPIELKISSFWKPLLAWLPGVAFATQVSVDRAYDWASATLGASLRSGSPIELLGSIPAVDSVSTCCYVFGNAHSFAVIAGDDCMTPVLGWSDQGTLDLDNLPDPLRDLFERYRQELAASSGAARHPDWNELRSAATMQMKLLMSAPWGQKDLYNKYTPVINGKQSPVGCVPLAAGIIMRFLDYPTEPAHKVDSYHNLDVPHENFDWFSIPRSTPQTEEEQDAVGKLLWHIGAHFKASYRETETAALMENALSALKNVYRMAPSTRYLSRKWLSDSLWYSLMRKEIDEGRLILYAAGQKKGIRHAFVCDGYSDNGAFHYNWGWGGNGNGFYQMSAMTPCEVAALDQDQEMILGIQQEWRSDNSDQMALYTNLSADYSADALFFGVRFQLFNIGGTPWTGRVSLGRFSPEGVLQKVVAPVQEVQQLKIGGHSDLFNFAVSLDQPLQTGESIRVIWSPAPGTTWQPLMERKDNVTKLSDGGLCYAAGYTETSDPKILLITNMGKDYLLPVTDGELPDDRKFIQFPFGVSGWAETDKISIGIYDESQMGNFVLDYATDMHGANLQRFTFTNGQAVEVPLPKPVDEVSSIYLRAYCDSPDMITYKLLAKNGAERNYPSFWTFNFMTPIEVVADYTYLNGDVGQEITFMVRLSHIDELLRGDQLFFGGVLRGLKAGQAELFTQDESENWVPVSLVESSEGLSFLNHAVGTAGSSSSTSGRATVRFKLKSYVPLDEDNGHELVVYPDAVGDYFIREPKEFSWALNIKGEAMVGNEEVVVDRADQVFSQQGQVMVQCERSSLVSIYDSFGRCYLSNRWVDQTMGMVLPQGLYFVRVGDRVYRVLHR